MGSKPWLEHYDAGVPSHIEYPEVSLSYFLEESARKFPDNPCINMDSLELTYSQVNRLADAFSAGLIRLGLQMGDRVAISLPNIPQFVIAFYAILKAGGIVVAMNPQYKQQELEFQLRNSGAILLIGLETMLPLFHPMKSRTQIRTVILTQIEDFKMLGSDKINNLSQMESSPFQGGADEITFIDLLKGTREVLCPNKISPDDPAIYQYSGGTTGIAKGAIGLHRNVVANTLQFRYWLTGLEDGKESVLVAIPLYHVYGMVIAMSVGMALAARLVLIPDARNLPNLLQNLDKFKATLFPGVPTMYQMIIRDADVMAGKYNLTSLKACISGSAPLLAETKRGFEKISGAKLLEGYGLSEAPTATHCNPMNGENRIGSIGLPLPDVDCRIVDLEEADCMLSPGKIGELLISAPQVMQGYHNMPEETQLTLRDHWLCTGDVAYMDKDGYFYLVDRKKELIKVSGFQVWPREVEETIARHPAVQEVGAAGIPDAVQGEVVKAWVVLRPGYNGIVVEEEIRHLCSDTLIYYKNPKIIEFIEKLPRTAVGKLLRRELVRLHNEQLEKLNL